MSASAAAAHRCLQPHSPLNSIIRNTVRFVAGLRSTIADWIFIPFLDSQEERTMKAPDSHTPDEMNWADYWDSLSNEYFALRASAEPKPAVLAEPMPDHAAFVATLHDMARELT
jgi:hypothetical protein